MQHMPGNGFHSSVATSKNNIWVVSIIMEKIQWEYKNTDEITK